MGEHSAAAITVLPFAKPMRDARTDPRTLGDEVVDDALERLDGRGRHCACVTQTLRRLSTQYLRVSTIS
jgi:hypothetical protein